MKRKFLKIALGVSLVGFSATSFGVSSQAAELATDTDSVVESVGDVTAADENEDLATDFVAGGGYTNQWQVEGDEYVYYDENGALAKGWKTIDGDRYYFDETTGYNYRDMSYWINDGMYRFDEDGVMVTGWYNETRDDYDDMYYYEASGKGANGRINVDGSYYYFENGLMSREAARKDGSKIYYFNYEGEQTHVVDVKEGWIKLGTEWCYVLNGELVDGWKKINGYYYYFISGIMLSDTSLGVDGCEYYLGKDGKMFTGWRHVVYEAFDYWYYYLPSGKMADGLQTINGSQYYFDDEMITNACVVDNGKVLRIAKDGKVIATVDAKIGWMKIGTDWIYCTGEDVLASDLIYDNGYWYYLDNGGLLVTNDTCLYWYDNSTDTSFNFNVDSKGRVITGWYSMLGRWHYLEDNCGLYAIKDMVYEVGGKMYRFDEEGALLLNDTFAVDDKLYHVYGDGSCSIWSDTKTGWVAKSYYIENGQVVTGWKQIGGKNYYFNPDGTAAVGIAYIDSKAYYFNEDGSLRTQQGWFTVEGCKHYVLEDNSLADGDVTIGLDYYYFDDLVPVTGIQMQGTLYQLFDKDGKWVGNLSNYAEPNSFVSVGDCTYYIDGELGLASYGLREINGKLYYINEDGSILKNSSFDVFYFGADGAAVENKWITTGFNRWSYYGEDGYIVDSDWKKISEKWYYFEDGLMVTGDQVINNKLYHFSNSGIWDGKAGVTNNGWVLINGFWHYYKSGVEVTGWCTIGNATYYFTEDGEMLYDMYVCIGNNFYAFDKSGKLVKNGWYNLGSAYGYAEWVYADADGKLLEGLQTIKGKQYYFIPVMRDYSGISYDETYLFDIDANGVIKKSTKATNGWVKISTGAWYYAENGYFVTGVHKINGKNYVFDSNGTLLNNTYYYEYGYADANGVLITSTGWKKTIDDIWYYLYDGTLQYGAYTVNGKDFYCRSEYAPCYYGVVRIDDKFYFYKGSDGGRVELTFKEGWNSYNDEWYYVSNGCLVTGWMQIKGEWYYFNDETAVLICDDIWYCSSDESDGEDGLFAFDRNGHIRKNQWISAGGGMWYYAGADGKFLKGTHVINGKKYTFSIEGYLYQ